MSSFSSLRFRLVGVVILAVAPALGLMLYTKMIWPGVVAGFLAVAAAWYGGEKFILRHVNALLLATKRLAAGDLSSRTGVLNEPGEMGELANSFDAMAESLERQVRKRELAEQKLLNHAHQQTVIAALGQFALITPDLSPLLDHAAIFGAQILGTEFCAVLEQQPDGANLVLRSGVGWRDGCVGHTMVNVERGAQAGFNFLRPEPVIIADLKKETRFQWPLFLHEHGIISGASVVIPGHHRVFGVLGVYSSQPRKFTDDAVHFLQAVANVLAVAVERKRTEPEIQKLAAFAQFNPNPVLEFTGDGSLTYFNKAALNMATSQGKEDLDSILPPDTAKIVQTCLVTGKNKLHLETQGKGRTFSWSFFPVLASQVVHCYVEDITERINLESQLRHSQKMETVGQLASGVAHDFNNILTVIQGHSGLLTIRPNLPPEMTKPLQSISFAAERAANLTRQLLMFSRKQVAQPKSLDLKEVIENMTKMLNRLLGANITLKYNPSLPIPPIQADAGMMEQVLLNLTVNARDAMANGGELTISTFTVDVNDAYVKLHPDARTGLFVCLRVTDTGCGMDPATVSRIFEPFFTTKGVGKGTGLGLATVYGIVKQHKGWIEVTSQVGEGTSFNIFIPASAAPIEAPIGQSSTAAVQGGHETILVVEDEPVLRELALIILKDQGYRVLEAASGVEALSLCQLGPEPCHLLLTDMILPGGLSGRELAGQLLIKQPKLKVILTSGHSLDETGGDGLPKGAYRFLQKPYNHLTLAKLVRETLDA
jgi:signal transduction histidine kinase/HAMP domain-containing protein/ActR/RegA family two-component response regulator